MTLRNHGEHKICPNSLIILLEICLCDLNSPGSLSEWSVWPRFARSAFSASGLCDLDSQSFYWWHRFAWVAVLLLSCVSVEKLNSQTKSQISPHWYYWSKGQNHYNNLWSVRKNFFTDSFESVKLIRHMIPQRPILWIFSRSFWRIFRRGMKKNIIHTLTATLTIYGSWKFFPVCHAYHIWLVPPI